MKEPIRGTDRVPDPLTSLQSTHTILDTQHYYKKNPTHTHAAEHAEQTTLETKSE